MLNLFGNNTTTAYKASAPSPTAAAAPAPTAPEHSVNDQVILGSGASGGIFEAMTPMKTTPYAQVVDPVSSYQVGLTRGNPADLLAVADGGAIPHNVVLIKDFNGDGFYDSKDLAQSTALLSTLAEQSRPAGDSFGNKGVSSQELLAQGFRAASWTPSNDTLSLYPYASDPHTGNPILDLGNHESLLGIVAAPGPLHRVNAVVSHNA